MECVPFTPIAGGVRRQTSMHRGQRGENLHPSGRSVGSGINPSIGDSLAVSSFRLGMEPKSPSV